MSNSNSDAGKSLSFMLPLYYKRLFPHKLFHRWLSYGNVDKNYFPYREFSFTLEDDIYLRYQSFDSCADMECEIQKRCPSKIDIGAVFNFNPKRHAGVASFHPVEKELVLDIDMTDYDDVRYCCSGADICNKCWKLMVIAIKIINSALKDDFGFQHILWVYSGRRGIHCWVCDDVARKLTTAGRSAIADYLTVVSGGENVSKKVKLYDVIHPAVKRAIRIIEDGFEGLHVDSQDFLSDEKRWKKVLGIVSDSQVRSDLEKEMSNHVTSAERWRLIRSVLEKHNQKNGKLHLTPMEIMLQLCYPRLDVNVTKGLNHLLKSPFSVHPKTGRVCVPINVNNLETFSPFSVPTLSQLVDEINKHDSEMQGMQENTSETKRIKDYKKTSLNNGIETFKEFIKGLESSRSGKLLEKSDLRKEF